MKKLEELDFSVRTYNALHQAGIQDEAQLRRMTDMELRRLKFMTLGILNEIRSKVPYQPWTEEVTVEMLQAQLQENAVARTDMFQRLTQALQEQDALKKQIADLEKELEQTRRAVCAKCKKPPDALPDGAVCGDVACPWHQYTKKGVGAN